MDQCYLESCNGCTKISPGCKHCYAEHLATRLQAMGQPNYKNGFKVTLQPRMLELPLRWKSPKRIFVNSMSDLFHEDVPEEYIKRVFEVMNRANWHQYQVLTKRPGRVRKMAKKLTWGPQIWMGVSVESQKYAGRIDDLRKTGAHVKFLSLVRAKSLIILIGLLSVGNQALAHGQLIRNGSPTSEISASMPAFHSSLSNGEAFRKRKLGASSRAGHGMKCQLTPSWQSSRRRRTGR
jgi:protein gp37